MIRQLGRSAVLAILVLLVSASPARAQWLDSAYRDLYEAVARRVASARITPSPLRIGVGDTAVVTVELLDAAGQPLIVTRPDGSKVTPAFYLVGSSFTLVTDDVMADMEQQVRLVGKRAGSDARVMTPKAPFPRQAGDRLEYAEYAVPITVGDRATERIEIEAGPFDAYVGSSIPHVARVWKKGTTLSEPAPVVAWKSSDPAVAAVTDGGTVTFLAHGRATISAENGGARAERTYDVRAPDVSKLTLTADTRDARTGDVVRLTARAFGKDGRALPRTRVNLAVSSDGTINARAGATAYDDGTFVAEEPGDYTVVAELGGVAARETIRARPRAAEMNANLVSHVSRKTTATTEIMVFEGLDKRDYAYLGALGPDGGRVIVYDVTDPANPVATDSVLTDARNVNDIRVDREVGARLAVFTKEGAPSRKNGIVLLDVSNPAHPVQLSEFTETTVAGVHDAWIYENRVYLTNDGTGDVHIIDVTDPRKPRETGRWSTGTPGRYVHDLFVQDGIAYLAYWDDGLIILDVGGAGKGGTLDKPVFVSRYAYGPGGHTHHAFRYKQYVFLADEGPEFIPRPANGPRGYVHIVDVSDLEHPKEVAKYYPTEAGAHNVWVENDKLYIAYYQGGLRVVDVSGDLRGDLYQQGRQIAWYHTRGGPGDYGMTEAFAWSPQLHKGHIFVSDMLSGMWVVKLAPKTTVTP